MHGQFKEPLAPSYIYINPENNHVHLLMPVAGGVDIGTDNTCKSVYSLQVFLGKKIDAHQNSALDELVSYQKALEYDITLPAIDTGIQAQKQHRLDQINSYISALESVQRNKTLDHLLKKAPEYPKALKNIMQERSNLYSMVLKPKDTDQLLTVVNPVFSVNRSRNAVFFKSLQEGYRTFKIPPAQDAQTRLTSAVLASLDDRDVDFEKIQHTITQEVKKLFDLDVDFSKNASGDTMTKEFIDDQMGFDNDATSEDYIASLIGNCSPNLFENIPDSPFNKIKKNDKEKLSILTQFLLAEVNIYCFAHNISTKNFGCMLDESASLGASLVKTVTNVLNKGDSVEKAICSFINHNKTTFELKQPLTLNDVKKINNAFIAHYATVENSDHFDEFMILDTDKAGKFVTYQGAICTDFAEFIGAGFPALDTEYLQQTRLDFENINGVIHNGNRWINTKIELPLQDITNKIQKSSISSEHLTAKEIKAELIKLRTEGLKIDKENISTGKLGNHS